MLLLFQHGKEISQSMQPLKILTYFENSLKMGEKYMKSKINIYT